MAKKTKKKATSKKKKASGVETVIVGSKVKAAIKESGCMTSGEFLAALNATVHETIAAACTRAQMNKRSTVRPQDI